LHIVMPLSANEEWLQSRATSNKIIFMTASVYF
jgi:hypothetical protein